MGRRLERFQVKRTRGRWEETFSFEERAVSDDDGFLIVRVEYLHSPLLEPGKSHRRAPLQWVPVGLDPLDKMIPSERRKMPRTREITHSVGASVGQFDVIAVLDR